jgi:DNA-directed RNA polymerase specialized sigma24 family protein
VFLRASKLISEGGVIINLSPWIKRTSYYVIRELGRKHNIVASLDGLDLEIRAHEEVEIEDFTKEINALKQALSLIPSIDERLLNLKVVEGKSWAEIASIMRIEGHGDAPEATWRKRKERALTRLRKTYHQILPSF